MNPQRLLVMSCSARKRKLPAKPIAAIERYDGVWYRVLRKWLQQSPDPNLIIIIISAKYGVIRSSDEIEWYDQLMTNEAAVILAKQFRAQVSEITRTTQPSSIFINVGSSYAKVIEDASDLLDGAYRATGAIGRRAQLLKVWLNGASN